MPAVFSENKKKVKRFDPYQGYIEQELPLEENANIEAINPMFFKGAKTLHL